MTKTLVTDVRPIYMGFENSRAYAEYIIGLVPGADTVVLGQGWNSSIRTVSSLPRAGTKARDAVTRTLRRDGDDLVVRLYNTDIVRIHPDGSTTLDNGGWATPTTHRSINAFLTGGQGVARRAYASRAYTDVWQNERDLPCTLPAAVVSKKEAVTA